MSKLVLELASALGSIASLVELAISFRDPTKPLSAREGAVFALAAVLMIVFLFLRIRDYLHRGIVTVKGPKRIKEYLHSWISRGQRVVIFSHDMSWVDDERMKYLLREKAERHELELCLPRAIPLSKELSERGAEVFTYSELGYVPTSRFTIINPGRYDSQMAIGQTTNDRHVIREISGPDPLLALANDLVAVVKRFNSPK
jgi:hypothetical protein